MEHPKLSLYHYDGCPYCARVRSAIERLGLDVELRNIHQHSEYRSELRRATGRSTVPCLRIKRDSGTQWMHESLDIIRFLEREIAGAA